MHRTGWGLGLVVLLLAAGCGPSQGSEGAACYPNDTCEGKKLTCLSGLCVEAPATSTTTGVKTAKAPARASSPSAAPSTSKPGPSPLKKARDEAEAAKEDAEAARRAAERAAAEAAAAKDEAARARAPSLVGVRAGACSCVAGRLEIDVPCYVTNESDYSMDVFVNAYATTTLWGIKAAGAGRIDGVGPRSSGTLDVTARYKGMTSCAGCNNAVCTVAGATVR